MRGFVRLAIAALLVAGCSTGSGTDSGPLDAGANDGAADALGGADASEPIDGSTDVRDVVHIDVPAEPPPCAVPCGDFRCLRCEFGCCVEVRDAGVRDVVDAPDVPMLRSCTDPDGDGYGVGDGCWGPDCDETDPLIHPAAMQRCNGLDNDCDGSIDQTTADAHNGELDGWCATYTTTTFELPPVCNYSGRVVSSTYVRTTLTHCEACNHSSSTGLWICTCWDPQSPTSGQWDCSTRP